MRSGQWAVGGLPRAANIAIGNAGIWGRKVPIQPAGSPFANAAGACPWGAVAGEQDIRLGVPACGTRVFYARTARHHNSLKFWPVGWMRFCPTSARVPASPGAERDSLTGSDYVQYWVMSLLGTEA